MDFLFKNMESPVLPCNRHFNKGTKNFKNVLSQGNSCYFMLKQIFEWPLNTPEFGLTQKQFVQIQLHTKNARKSVKL